MGDYTHYAGKLKVKKELPPEVELMIDVLYTDHETWWLEYCKLDHSAHPILKDLTAEKIFNIANFITFVSGYSCWGWRVKEDAGEYWLLESRSCAKARPDEKHLFLKFLTTLLPYLIVEEGDILFRSTYEYDFKEEIYYFEDGVVKRSYELGCQYLVHEYESVRDDRHPSMHRDRPDLGVDPDSCSREPENPENFIPPWTLKELAVVNEQFRKDNPNWERLYNPFR